MPDFVPHTESDIAAMLAFLGLGSTEELFAAIPTALRLAGGLDLPAGRPESDVAEELAVIASTNLATGGRNADAVCFAGGGAYDREIPAVTRALAGRSEFVTAYTPYQPEVAQGVLQALFEYQSLIARITGLPISNSSLYDGSAALVEGVNMACADRGGHRVLVSRGVHPHWRGALATFARGSGHVVELVELDDGTTDWSSVVGDAACLCVAYPNYLGVLEDLDAARAAADRTGALLVVCQDPVAAGLLVRPGDKGADIVVGEAQSFGTALSFGGPYLGFIACRDSLVRRLPGRLVGETVDVDGTRAYVTTLRAREQDIRREKASSNVCTNETLMAVTAAIQLGWLGSGGLRAVALASARAAAYARSEICALPGVSLACAAPTLSEFAVRLPMSARRVVDEMLAEGYLAGVPITEGFVGTDLEDTLLVACTERRTRAQIDGYVAALARTVAQ